MQSEAVAEFFAGDRFAREAGVRAVSVRPGFGSAEMIVEPRHLNAVGILQGGAPLYAGRFRLCAGMQFARRGGGGLPGGCHLVQAGSGGQADRFCGGDLAHAPAFNLPGAGHRRTRRPGGAVQGLGLHQGDTARLRPTPDNGVYTPNNGNPRWPSQRIRSGRRYSAGVHPGLPDRRGPVHVRLRQGVVVPDRQSRRRAPIATSCGSSSKAG